MRVASPVVGRVGDFNDFPFIESSANHFHIFRFRNIFRDPSQDRIFLFGFRISISGFRISFSGSGFRHKISSEPFEQVTQLYSEAAVFFFHDCDFRLAEGVRGRIQTLLITS